MKRANRREHHYIYKITRTDGSRKYYIGMHSTDNLDDGYFGSGSLLSKSIKKHGKEKHHKEILEHLPTREALKLREKELVNKELIDDKKCMNLVPGGGGGEEVGRLGGVALAAKRSKDSMFDEKIKEKISKKNFERFLNQEEREKQRVIAKEQWVNDPTMLQKTQAGQKKYRELNADEFSKIQGAKTRGKIWVTDGTISKMILEDDLKNYSGWKRGRCRFLNDQ